MNNYFDIMLYDVVFAIALALITVGMAFIGMKIFAKMEHAHIAVL